MDSENPNNHERPLTSPMVALTTSGLVVEKARVAAAVRKAHLENRDQRDPETDELLRRLQELEDYIMGRVAFHIQSHPAFPWFSRVKGVGKENIAKVVAFINIEKADTISALWKFAGFAPDDAGKPKAGKVRPYNAELRTMCWRLAGSLLKANGKFHQFYLEQKDAITKREEAKGTKIVPTPAVRFCPTCSKEVRRVAARFCPDCHGALSLKKEPPGYLYQGHLHAMAQRKMVKAFLACLWLVWREAEGLPTRAPYAAEYLGHTHIFSPEDMVDR